MYKKIKNKIDNNSDIDISNIEFIIDLMPRNHDLKCNHDSSNNEEIYIISEINEIIYNIYKYIIKTEYI